MTAPTTGSPVTPAPANGLREWFGRWLSRLMIVCAVGTCINFAGLAIALILISHQAGDGADARDRQQAVYPVSLKLYEWAHAHPESRITDADLACFKLSSACPARPNK